MNKTNLEITVLREYTHGIPTQTYYEELCDRLPHHTVRVARTPREERELAATADIITGRGIDRDVIERGIHIGLFAGISAGHDHLPLDSLKQHDIAATTASGIHAPNIAEQVLGYILVFTRNLHEGWRRQQRREWRHFQSHELKGSTVTIVGLGMIGQAIVQRLSGFSVETIGVRYTPSKGGQTDEIVGFEKKAIHEALARTEYLVLACPLTETTNGLIGEEEFTTLPSNAVTVNVGRGGVMDTSALISALRSNSIRGAALDVSDPEPLPENHPLWALQNVLITPHNAGHSPMHCSRLANLVSENVHQIAETGRYNDLRNQILYP